MYRMAHICVIQPKAGRDLRVASTPKSSDRVQRQAQHGHRAAETTVRAKEAFGRTRCEGGRSASVLTLLEVFRVRWGVGLTDFIRETGYSRSHVLRVRNGDIEPSRDFIAAAVSALRHLTLQSSAARRRV